MLILREIEGKGIVTLLCGSGVLRHSRGGGAHRNLSSGGRSLVSCLECVGKVVGRERAELGLRG